MFVLRIVSCTGSPPATVMVSCRTASGRHCPSTWYQPPSTFSRYRSVTSGLRLVKPQAMRALCPMTTPGIPENVNPSTSYPQSQCRPIWYQIPGIDGDRCGSLARIGLPVAVSAPDTTQLLDPIPGRSAASPIPPSTAAAVNTPLWTVPPSTMGGCNAYGYCGYRSSIRCRVRPEASRTARVVSSTMLPRRSHAIALSQARLSIGSHGAIRYPPLDSPSNANSRPAAGPECSCSQAFTPVA